jgi:acrylyl-CoA reductase (NADPH)
MQHAWIATVDAAGARQPATLVERPELPAGTPVLRVQASALNYKDALALTGRGAIIRNFPCVPGVDVAGVLLSAAGPHAAGSAVFSTGWGYGEERDGGLANTMAITDPAHLQPIPAGWDADSVMGLGTAALTAAQGVQRLEQWGLPAGPIAITGASGGVAMFAIRLLAAAGREVVAVSGKADDPAAVADLMRWGAARVIGRNELLAAGGGGSLARTTYAGGFDCTGGAPLAALLKQVRPYGAVATCGVAAGSNLDGDLFPFVLRGVGLLGLSSVNYPATPRAAAWQRLFATLRPEDIRGDLRRIPLANALDEAYALLAGTRRGRAIVVP